MQWLANWWSEISVVTQVFLCAAIPATLIMLIQTVMMLFGMGFGGDADGDGVDFDGADDFDIADGLDAADDFELPSGDADVDFDPGLRIFSVRGLVAFFAIGGWVGVVATEGGLTVTLSAVLAFVAGFAALVFAALIVKWALKLQDSGNINPANAIAHTGTVYIPIPQNRLQTGRITLLLQGRYVELDAVTDSDFTIKTGTAVQVTGVVSGSCLVVRPLMAESRSDQ